MNRYLILIFTFIAVFSCEKKDIQKAEKPKTTNNNVHQVHTEIGNLTKLIDLPYPNKYIRWQISEIKESKTASLTVLVKFSEDDFNQIVTLSPPLSRGHSHRIRRSIYTDWFPKNLKNRLNASIDTKTAKLEKVNIYEPSQFINQDLSPFVNGHIVSLDQNYILIELYSF